MEKLPKKVTMMEGPMFLLLGCMFTFLPCSQLQYNVDQSFYFFLMPFIAVGLFLIIKGIISTRLGLIYRKVEKEGYQARGVISNLRERVSRRTHSTGRTIFYYVIFDFTDENGVQRKAMERVIPEFYFNFKVGEPISLLVLKDKAVIDKNSL